MRPINYQWPAQDKALIAPVQSLSAAGDLQLTFSPFVYNGISRSVSITADSEDLSTAFFTIHGLYKGQLVSKTIQGPTPNSTIDTSDGIYTPNTYPTLSTDDVIFDVVTRVSVDAPVEDVSVGTGRYGRTAWFTPDYFSVAINSVFMQVLVPADSTIQYSYGATLQDVGIVPDSNLFLVDTTGGSLTQKNNSQFSGSQSSFLYGAIFVTTGDPGTDDTGTLEAIMVQQGSPRG